MAEPVIVGLLDSGLRADQSGLAIKSRRFWLDDDVRSGPGGEDAISHGAMLADVILSHAPGIAFLNAKIFAGRPVTEPAVIAAGLRWLVAEGAALINMSFGLRDDREVLRQACEQVLAAGVIVVAASPARGDAVYPAAYDGVLSASGDARCAPGDISHLASRQAEFGACPRGIKETAGPLVGGASLATAHVSGKIAAYLVDGGTAGEARAHLQSIAKYHGPEQVNQRR